jgi:hypothetical protein
MIDPPEDDWDNALVPLPLDQEWVPLVGAGYPPQRSSKPPQEICFDGKWVGICFGNGLASDARRSGMGQGRAPHE